MGPHRGGILRPDAGASDRLRLTTRSAFEKLRSAAIQRALAPGDVVLPQDEPPLYALVLCKGLVKLAHQDDDGRDTVIATQCAERPLGTSALVAGVPYPYRVEAVTTCIVHAIGARTFQECIACDVQFSRDLLVVHALDALETETLRTTDTRSARQRIVRLIGTIASIQGTLDGPLWVRVQLPVTHESLASLAGVTPETFSRTLVKMEHETLIERGRGWLRVRREPLDGCQELIRRVDVPV